MTRPVLIAAGVVVLLLVGAVAWYVYGPAAAGTVALGAGLVGVADKAAARELGRRRERLEATVADVPTIPTTTADQRLAEARGEIDEVPLEELVRREREAGRL